MNDVKPWYKQFWPWFIIAFPLTSVIAGLTTVYIASSGADTVVTDDYYKKGLAYNKNTQAEHKAKELEIEITLEDADKSMVLKLASNQESQPKQLSAYFSHSTKQELDFQLIFQNESNGYIAKLPYALADNQKWYVAIQPLDQSWKYKLTYQK